MTGDLSAVFDDDFHGGTNNNSNAVLFWGSQIAFSNWILRVARNESGASFVGRIGSVRELEASQGCQRHVFFDDTVAEMLLTVGTHTLPNCRKTNWVFAYRDEVLARRVLKMRATDQLLNEVGVLPMNATIDAWTHMFRLALTGNFVIPGALISAPADHGAVSDSQRAEDITLTPRETEVLALVAQGHRNKTIAHQMGLSEHTVKLHLHHVITKIGVKNRTQAAQWYLTR